MNPDNGVMDYIYKTSHSIHANLASLLSIFVVNLDSNIEELVRSLLSKCDQCVSLVDNWKEKSIDYVFVVYIHENFVSLKIMMTKNKSSIIYQILMPLTKISDKIHHRNFLENF